MGATMSESPSSPPSGWYPDPAGGVGLRYWDGAAWTERTEPTPTALESPLAAQTTMSRVRRGALVAGLVVALLIADIGLRNFEMKRLMEAAFASEAVMLSYTQELDAYFDRLPPDGPRSEQEWFALYDHIHETAAASYFELTYRRARVDTVFVAPWHRNAVEAKRRYLEHNIAWSDELDAVAANPPRLLEPVANDIGSSWQITKVALRNAIPTPDLLGIRADVDRFIEEGDNPGGQE
jgi:hypothetical protein